MNYDYTQYSALKLVNNILIYIESDDITNKEVIRRNITNSANITNEDDTIVQMTNYGIYRVVIDFIMISVFNAVMLGETQSFLYLKSDTDFLNYIQNHNIILVNTDNLRGEENTKIWIDYMLYLFDPYGWDLPDEIKAYTMNDIFNKFDKVFPGIIFGG